MKYKENWEQAKERLTAFWHQEIIDRCCIAVTAPRHAAAELTPPPVLKDINEQWTGAAYLVRRQRYNLANTYFAGEAFPHVFLNLGAGGHAGFFRGAKFQFEPDTVWFYPTLDDPEQLYFDDRSFLYQKTLELAKSYAEDSRGDYFISMPDTTGNADALSHLMGAENLLTLMAEEPERAETALCKIEPVYERIMTETYRQIEKNNEGGSGVGWLRTWAPGMHAQMQCDMSVMISNAMFERFIMPELTKQSEFLEYALYHFDGIEQLRHLDSLLSIPDLRAIQWTQVAGQPPATDYIPALQKIQKAGKSLIIYVSPAQIKPLMEQLSSKGLYLLTDARSPEEADEIVRIAEKLTHI
jgi:hypothetical protein